jgi:hypothetical protein
LLLVALARVCLAADGEGIGVTVGPSVLGGTLVGFVSDVQVSRTTWFDAGIGFRPGVSLQETIYPNFALHFGISAQFGERPLRNGLFVTVNSTLPLAFYEAWAAGGWSIRIWDKHDVNSFTIDIGPGMYFVRELPPEVDLRIPVFLSTRVAAHFPVLDRGGNTSERRARRRLSAPDEE